MIKTITKKQVIKALKTEPLTKGSYFHSQIIKGYKCDVCAVGAVLRHMSFEKWALENRLSTNALGTIATKGLSIGSNHKNLIKNGNYFGALSCYFEAGHSKSKCIQYVEKNFPLKLTLEINETDLGR